jgi:DUF4097 and DUF4098 domain-containing protein YvlB
MGQAEKTAFLTARQRHAAVGAVLVIGLMAAPAAAQTPQDTSPHSDQTVSVNRGARLLIHNMAGEVVIHTWEKDALRVQARHSARVKVNIRQTEAGVTVRADASNGPAGSVDYDITAPAWMPVKVEGTYAFVQVDGAQNEVSAETVRGDIMIKGGSGFVTAKTIEGEVIVENAKGRINASSVNEKITITGSSGDIVAETTNGSITLTKVDAKSVDVATVNGNIIYDGVAVDGGRYSFVTHNGNITMGVPATTNATFTVRTYNGAFRPELPVKTTEEVRRGRRAVFTLGTGSAQVELESFGGTIRLRPPGVTVRSKE